MSFWATDFWAEGFWATEFWTEETVVYDEIALCAISGTLVDSFTQTDDGQTFPLFGGGIHELTSQSWESGADPRALVGACIRVYRTGTPTGRLKLSIRAHSGTLGTSSVPTGSDLVASAELDISAVLSGVGNAAFYAFPLSGWTPDPSTEYMFVLDASGITGDESNCINLVIESGAEATHAGNFAFFSGSWTPVSGTDVPFRVYEALSFANVASRTSLSLHFGM